MNFSTDTSGPASNLQAALRRTAELLKSSPLTAAAQARAILAAYPGQKYASVLLAAAERRSGQPEIAIRLVSAVLEEHPGFATALEELGVSHLAAGQWVEAEDAICKALAVDERLQTAWLALGDIRAARGDQQGSNDAYQKHSSLTSGNLGLVRAASALIAGDRALAETLCREFLQREPHNVAALRMLAEIAIQFGRLDDAETLLSGCLELAPDFHLARHDCASLKLKTMRFHEALHDIEKVLLAQPNGPSHLLLKAAILAQIGNAEDAIKIYDAVLQQYPEQARIHLSKGHALKTLGHQAVAVAAYREAIASQPNLGEAYWSLANLKTFRFEDTEILQMKDRLTTESTSPEDFFHLSFALGKALEDKGEFPESFQYYATGNAARRRNVHWDSDEHHANMRKSANFFQKEFFASRRSFGNPSAAPIFIVGLPRAGSTLLEQILASHSQVEGTMELPDIMSIVLRINNLSNQGEALQYPEILRTLPAAEFSKLGADYLARTAVHRTGKPCFIDKMPNNFAYIGLIHLILPNARILDARRHPMACGFSIFKQLFAHGQNFSYSLEEIGRFYRDYVEIMSHWDTVLPGRVHRVDYENLVGDTVTEVGRILEFCELEFEQACVEFHRNRRAVRTASSEQVRQPIYTSALSHWRNYEAFLEPLAKALAPDCR